MTTMTRNRETAEERLERRPLGGKFALALLFLAGAALPTFTVLFEQVTGACASTLFDPLPTTGHFVLLLLVPVAFVVLAQTLLRRTHPLPRWYGPVLGVVLGVTTVYGLVFAPLSPLAAFAVIAGIGIPALSPVLAWLATLRLWWRSRKVARLAGAPFRGVAAGFLVAWVALCLFDVPSLRAEQRIVELQEAGPAEVHTLREEFSVATLEQFATGGTRTFSPLSLLVGLRSGHGNISAETFYRVVGRLPDRGAGRWWPPSDDGFRGRDSEIDWDFHEVEGLCVSRSEIAGRVQPGLGQATVAWDLEFHNDDWRPAEARMVLHLPAAAVVSDATLWVSGEPRRAVFGGSEQVRAAYEAVVRQRRDPLLITSYGRDGIQVECFPVPANGGTMRIRLDLVIPTRRTDAQNVRLDLPRIERANHGLCDTQTHDVRIASPLAPAEDESRYTVAADTDGFRARGSFATDELGSRASSLLFMRNVDPVLWSEDPHRSGVLVTQTMVERHTEPLPALVLVAGAGQAMATHRDDVASVLAAVPDGTELAVILASDDVVRVTKGFEALDAAARSRITEGLAAVPWAGGIDALPALAAADGLAASRVRCRVLWLHGPQPFFLGTTDWEFDPDWTGMARTTPVPLAIGHNVVAASLALSAAHEPVPDRDTSVEGVRRMIAQWCSPDVETLPAWSEAAVPPVGTAAVRVAPEALLPLWAAAEIERRLGAGRRAEAVRLGRRYRVVSAVTGAVVLETDEEYVQAGLAPFEPTLAPAVPEPATVGLLLVAALLLGAWTWRRRRRLVPA